MTYDDILNALVDSDKSDSGLAYTITQDTTSEAQREAKDLALGLVSDGCIRSFVAQGVMWFSLRTPSKF